jgi:hypothetical protein
METFLTKTQVFDFFDLNFSDVEQEFCHEISIRGCDATDFSRGNENQNACIPLNRIFQFSMCHFTDSQVRG